VAAATAHSLIASLLIESDEHISRRALLRGGFLRFVSGGTPEAQSEERTGDAGPSAHRPLRHARAFPVFRPPGAVDEQAFLDGCTRCDACIQACPHDAIVHAPPRFRGAAGTPMIDPGPTGAPCRMCDDFPCIAACEPNVLRLDAGVRMGMARIDILTCLAHTGSFCTVCSEQCPVDGAIEVHQGRPRIIEDCCTGCGVCHHVCPSQENAVLLMPAAERPLPKDARRADHGEEIDGETGDGERTPS